MQGNGTVAAVYGAEMLYIVAALRVGLVVPLVAVAGNVRKFSLY